jgi:hypothetical protein
VRALLAILLAACATTPASPVAPLPTDAIWAASIHPGDLVVAVPGTGAFDSLGTFIDQSAVIDRRANPDVNPIALEQAIAAAQRAGVDPAAVELAVWGTGATQRASFEYRSLAGPVVTFTVLGGENSCATGHISDNLLKYTRDNADVDARDLAARIAGRSQQVTIVAHSWGGAVAEHLALDHLGDASIAFVFAAGVPKLIAGEGMMGPGMKPEGTASLYEVDRPDDPVHALDFQWDIEGHQYDIMWGSDFRGSYGITTEDMSCHDEPGACPTM